MNTLVNKIMTGAFHAARDPRSSEYQFGARAMLTYKLFGGERPACPYRLGTAQADAWFAGIDEGRALFCGACEIAKPDKQPSGFVWWACGGDGHGLDIEHGVVPIAVAKRLRGTVAPPKGNGGSWYASEREAIDDLRKAAR